MPNSYSTKNAALERNADKINTIILGSSHSYYGLRPEILGDSVLNLANISQTPEYDLALLEKWLPKMPNVKRVIISISYFTFVESRMEDFDHGTLAVNYKVFMHLDLHSDFSKYNFILTDRVQYFGRLKSIVFPRFSNQCDTTGFGLGDNLSNREGNWEEFGKKRAEDITIPSDHRTKDILATFDKLMTLLQSRGIECIMITTPTWHTFRENIDIRQYNNMVKYATEIAAKYNCKYLNFFDSSEFVDEDFHDVDHLSDIGADKLSRIVRQEFKNQ